MTLNTVEDVVRDKGRDVVTSQPTEAVTEAVKRMKTHRVGSVVIIDGRELVGVLTKRDVVERVVAGHRDPNNTEVREVMSTGLVTVTPQTKIQEAMDLVMRTGYCHLPVTDGNQLVGFVTKSDLSSWLLRYQEHQISDLVTYITRA